MLVLKIILCAVVSYLIGSISIATIISNSRFGDDVRNHGSGNAGSTNMLRTYGWKWALLTFALDILKGFVAAFGSMLILGDLGIFVGSAAVILGHNWPIFFGFRGGKGVATSVGGLLVFMPVQTLIIVLVCVIIILLTRIVSIASIIGATLVLITGLITFAGAIYLQLTVIFMVAFLLFQHRENIKRLIKKKENTI